MDVMRVRPFLGNNPFFQILILAANTQTMSKSMRIPTMAIDCISENNPPGGDPKLCSFVYHQLQGTSIIPQMANSKASTYTTATLQSVFFLEGIRVRESLRDFSNNQ